MREYHIESLDHGMVEAINHKIDNLNKPKGSLGFLEALARQTCLIQRTLCPTLIHPCHLLMGGDHGIERHGVSKSPREVTWQQMINFSKGGGGVNMFCRQHHFDLRIIDMGVDHDLTACPGILNHKIDWGTKDFMEGPAMSEEQFEQALATGAELVDQCHSEGCNVICIGEMGIANTSPSSIWVSVLCNTPLDICVGAGSGLDRDGVRRKYELLKQAQDHFLSVYGKEDVPFLLRYFGGFEMVGAIGAMLRAAEKRMIILVDGFIMSACMLGASALYPQVLDYAVFGHCGSEPGHRLLISHLGVRPILQLDLCLGEGTGALCAYPILESAVRMINEMNNFENANITKYF